MKINYNGKCGLTWAEVKQIASRAVELALDQIVIQSNEPIVIEESASKAIAEFILARKETNK